MFRAKRDDTLVGTIERQYGIDLHARSDMTLGTLLDERGFDSLTQLLAAYQGRLTYHARRRRLFISFDADDKPQVQGFRLMAYNPNVDLDFYDGSLQMPVNSERSGYVKQVLREKISRCSVVVCLIGNATAWSEWVDWELRTGRNFGKGLCGVRLKGSRGQAPSALAGEPVAGWDTEQIVRAIECAAARRS
jgi:hypothetical protein